MNDPRPDRRHADALRRWFFPWKLPSARAAQAGLAALVARMTAQHPERFSAAALWQRPTHRAHHVILVALLSILTALLVPTSWTWAAPGGADILPHGLRLPRARHNALAGG